MRLQTIPPRLLTSRLPTGEHEFLCFLRPVVEDGSPVRVERLTWAINAGNGDSALVSGTLVPSEQQVAQGRISIAALLPPGWSGGELQVSLHMAGGPLLFTVPIEHYAQQGHFRLPLTGPVLVVGGHRIGEVHRSAWRIYSQQFAWDFLPLASPVWAVFGAPPTDQLRAQDFTCFGAEVVAPAGGTVVRAAGDQPDSIQVGELPAPETFLNDFTRALGNYVVIEHADAVWSLLAHLQQGSVPVQAGQPVEPGQVVGKLGNSGNSTGPHLHFQFMDGPDPLSASPLPVALDIEGQTSIPQAGEIITG